jgi:hypothetical protein
MYVYVLSPCDCVGASGDIDAEKEDCCLARGSEESKEQTKGTQHFAFSLCVSLTDQVLVLDEFREKARMQATHVAPRGSVVAYGA